LVTRLKPCVNEMEDASLTVGLLPRRDSLYNRRMEIEVIVHDAEEGGYWAEVPAIPGCASQGETVDELLQNIHEAIEGCLNIDVAPVT
jgi:predicted RNase H-like HicB family nuclease